MAANQLAADLDAGFAGKTPLERLALLAESVDGRRVFTTSLGLEDQMLTHLIFENALPFEVVTLDTGPVSYTHLRAHET